MATMARVTLALFLLHLLHCGSPAPAPPADRYIRVFRDHVLMDQLPPTWSQGSIRVAVTGDETLRESKDERYSEISCGVTTTEANLDIRVYWFKKFTETGSVQMEWRKQIFQSLINFDGNRMTLIIPNRRRDGQYRCRACVGSDYTECDEATIRVEN